MKTTTGLNPLRAAAIAVTVLIATIGLSGCSKEPAKTVTIAYSNDLLGTIYPCDCPGEEYGGLPRRASFLETVRDTTENFLLLEGGGFFGREVSFGEANAELYLKSMAYMGFDGMVVGEGDFGFGTDYIVKRTAEAGLPILVANLYDVETDELLFSSSSWVSYPNGLKIGLIGVIGDGLKFPPQVDRETLRVTDPAAAIRRELANFDEVADVVVVLAHMPLTEARHLAKAVPEIDLIICGHEGKPLRKKNQRFGNAFILQIPKEGKHGGIAFAVVGKDGGIRELTSDITPLSKRYVDHEAVMELIRAYGL
jgi:5'-nucleotidase